MKTSSSTKQGFNVIGIILSSSIYAGTQCCNKKQFNVASEAANSDSLGAHLAE